jgi:microcystin-dependent protein
MNLLDFMVGMTGVVLPFAGSSPPSGWLLCNGQQVSRTTYPELFAAIGTTFGVGDGSTTFNVPDLRGRVAAGKDDMGGTAANVLQVSTTITTTAGSATATVGSASGLAIGMSVKASTVPAGVTISDINGTTVTLSTGTGVTAGTSTAARFSSVGDAQSLGSSGGTQAHTMVTKQMPAHNHTFASGAQTMVLANGPGAGVAAGAASGQYQTMDNTGGGQPHPNVQPTMVLNHIIKA